MTKRITPMIDDPAEPALVRELLEAGRNDAVEDYDYGKGLAALVAGIDAGAPVPEWAQNLDVATGTATTGTHAAAGGAAAVSTSAVGWVVGSIVGAGLAAAVVFSGSPQPEQAPSAAPQAVVAPQAVQPGAPTTPSAVAEALQAPAEAAQPVAAPRPGEQSAAALPAPVAEPEEAANADKRPLAAEKAAKKAPARPSVAKAAEAKADAPSRDLDTLMQEKVGRSVARTGRPAASADALDEPAAEAEAEVAPVEQPARAVAPSKLQYDDARLEREMRMLKVAESVLGTNPARALKLARQGEKEFAGSMFTQERQQVLLLALVELGRMDEARRLAKPYLQKYPRGPFSDRVRRALATGTVGR